MGCDIHLCIEYERYPKTKDDVKFWAFNWEPINPGRNYWVFSAMTNSEVRGYGDKWDRKFPLRGIPNDVDWGIKSSHQEENGDAHSESWLTLLEFSAVLEMVDEKLGEIRGVDEEYYMIEAAMKVVENKNPRIVFWFDN